MRELSSHEQTLTPFDRLLYRPIAWLLCLPFDSPRANDLRLSRHNNTALREETPPTLGEEPLPLLRLTVLIEVFFPFSYGFRDLGYMVLFGKNFSTTNFYPTAAAM